MVELTRNDLIVGQIYIFDDLVEGRYDPNFIMCFHNSRTMIEHVGTNMITLKNEKTGYEHEWFLGSIPKHLILAKKSKFKLKYV